MIHKTKLSIRDKILIILSKGGIAKTAYQVLEALENLGCEDIKATTVTVLLSQLKSDNFVTFEKEHCHCCGHATGHYKLTDDGYIKVRDLGPALTTIREFANLDELVG